MSISFALWPALLPALAMLFYVWYIDKLEREPIRFVLLCFLGGVLSIIPAIILEVIGEGILNALGLYNFALLYYVLMYFGVVAVSEECSKRLPLRYFMWKKPDFNYRFDAVVYCVAAALGFAAAENVEYAVVDGVFEVGRLIPVHTICGLYMGWQLGLAKQAEVNGETAVCKRHKRLSILFPVLIHGAWDFSVSMGSDLLASCALIGILVLTVLSYFFMRKLAKNDQPFVPPYQSRDVETQASQAQHFYYAPQAQTYGANVQRPDRAPAYYDPATGMPIYRDLRDERLFCIDPQTGNITYLTQ